MVFIPGIAATHVVVLVLSMAASLHRAGLVTVRLALLDVVGLVLLFDLITLVVVYQR